MILEEKTIATIKSEILETRIENLKQKFKEGSVISPIHLKEALLVIYELQLQIKIQQKEFSDYIDKPLLSNRIMLRGLRRISDSRAIKTIEHSRSSARESIEEGKWS